MVYASLEDKIREKLSTHNKAIVNQKGKLTATLTARWIFHCFIGIQLLIINNKERVMINLNSTHKLIISLFGKRYLNIYLIDGLLQ